MKSKLDYLVRSLNHEYGVYIGREFVLDCYESAMAGLCKASRVNSPSHLFLRDNRGVRASANLKISVNVVTRKASLKAIKAIKAGDELFVNYDDAFTIVV